jgi:hypothetical protein
MEALAINVAANTNEPGFRGPIYPDGSFTYVPIPESEPTSEPVPTYADLAAADFGGPGLPFALPDDIRDRPVHLDPEFATYPRCERYTYGDEWGTKASRIAELSAGDWLYFYATLSTVDPGASADWIGHEWGAYLIGGFRLASDPVTADYEDLPADGRTVFENNAHVKRQVVDARVLVHGEPGRSRLFDRAVPLSSPDAGADSNDLVDASSDSGRGPWWRRPLPFEGEAAEQLVSVVDHVARSDGFDADPEDGIADTDE